MVKAISYIRFSSGQQEKGDSIRRQEEMAKAWSSQRNIPLSPLNYRDLGTSAYRGKNAQIGMLRAFIQEASKPNGLIQAGDYLIIEAFDRLSRLPAVESYEIAKEILAKGIIIVTLNNGVEYSFDTLRTDQGKMFILFGDLYAAHHYSSNLSRRSKGAHERVRQTLLAGGRMKHKCPSWLTWNASQNRYDINDEGDIVREIWKIRAKPGHGYTAIASTMKENGYHCPHPRGWSHYIYRCFFHYQEAIGSKPVKDSDGKLMDTIKSYYPAVITQAIYSKAMANREREAFWKPAKSAYINLFTGLVKCHICGGSCKSYTSKKKRGDIKYLVCVDRRINKTCPGGTSVRIDFLEGRVLGHITNELAASDLLNQDSSQSMTEALDVIKTIEMRIADFTSKSDALAEALADGSLNQNAKRILTSKLNGISDELSMAEISLDEAKKRSSMMQQALDTSGSDLVKIRKLVGSDNLEDRKALKAAIASLIQKIRVVSKDRIVIQFRTGLIREIKYTKFKPVGLGVVEIMPSKKVYSSDINAQEIDEMRFLPHL